MNILILILTAHTYLYQKNGDCFKGANSKGVAAPTTQQETRRQPQCTSSARVRSVMWIQGGLGGGVSIGAFWREIPRFPD